MKTDWSDKDFTGMPLINSWYFDFENKKAYRDPKYKFYDKDEVRNMVYICFIQEDDELKNRRLDAGQYVWKSFFDAPEDGFNRTITDKYKEWVMEKVLLGDV